MQKKLLDIFKIKNMPFKAWVVFYGTTAIINLIICQLHSPNNYFFNDSCYLWALISPFIYIFYPLIIPLHLLDINLGLWGIMGLYLLLANLFMAHKVFADVPQSSAYQILTSISDFAHKYFLWLLVTDFIIYTLCQISKLVIKSCTELTCLC